MSFTGGLVAIVIQEGKEVAVAVEELLLESARIARAEPVSSMTSPLATFRRVRGSLRRGEEAIIVAKSASGIVSLLRRGMSGHCRYRFPLWD